MTIGYALLDEPIAPFKPTQAPTPLQIPQILSGTTECNYLVMFFVIGVLGLALRDMTSSK